MSLVGMSLRGYRCFEREQHIDLAPITVVLGRNNSGKSALVRAPVLIETGIRTDSNVPLDSDRLSEEMVDSFADLVFEHAPHRGIGIDLQVRDGRDTLGLSVEVVHREESRDEVVNRLELSRDGDTLGRLDWDLTGPGDRLSYTVQMSGRSQTGLPVEFAGLLPRAIPEVPDAQPMIDAAARIVAAYPTVCYFGPFRDRADGGTDNRPAGRGREGH